MRYNLWIMTPYPIYPICDVCKSPFSGKRCFNCKRNDRHAKQGHKISTCKTCGVLRRCYSNGSCKDCLKPQGLFECKMCHEVKMGIMSFQAKQAVCRECRSKHAGPPEYRRQNQTLMAKYGISYKQYIAMAEAQGLICAICKRRPKQALVVDHDHKTGKVRGLLCHACNIGIGNLQDSIEILAKAIEYLK